jgi:tripartite-type tricarboxylate transporter receptor subunit TctC
MRLARRRFLQLAVSAAAPAIARGARAENYPSRPIHFVVGFPPGGAGDLIARLVGNALSERLNQTVVIENRAGASGNIATEYVIRARPDGYTLLDVTAINAWNVSLYDNLKFDILRDLVPIVGMYKGPGLLVVHPSLPVKTLPEFIDYLKAHPGDVRMGSGGIGGPQHLYGELFKRMVGVDMLHVPYRGGGPAMTDLLAGHVQVMFDTIVTAVSQVRAGQLRALGVTSAMRAAVLPDVPAIAEVVPGYEAAGWQGIAAPVGTSADIVDRLNRETNACLADAKLVARLTDLGGTPFPCTPQEFRTFIAEFIEKWAKVIRAAGIKAG